MELNLLFDSIDEGFLDGVKSPGSVASALTINTYSISETDGFDLALIGLTDTRGTDAPHGMERAPQFIRERLYGLKKGSGAYRILDLGDLRNGPEYEDTQHRLEEVCHWLLSKKIIPVILGGTHDFALPQFKAYEPLGKLISVVNLDSYVDLSESGAVSRNERFLFDLFTQQPNFLFNYIHLAYQTYLNDESVINTLETLFFDGIRLGQIKSKMKNMEPLVREADMMVWDVAAIQNTYCPGNQRSQVFGLTGEEACQLSWYAGQNTKLSSFGIYEYHPDLDNEHRNTASVIATMIWYFIEGFYQRQDETGFTTDNYLKYEVSLEKTPSSMVFYKSKMTDKWWMEVPYPNDVQKFARNAIVPCSYEDYTMATDGEIPARWIEMQAKFS